MHFNSLYNHINLPLLSLSFYTLFPSSFASFSFHFSLSLLLLLSLSLLSLPIPHNISPPCTPLAPLLMTLGDISIRHNAHTLLCFFLLQREGFRLSFDPQTATSSTRGQSSPTPKPFHSNYSK